MCVQPVLLRKKRLMTTFLRVAFPPFCAFYLISRLSFSLRQSLPIGFSAYCSCLSSCRRERRENSIADLKLARMAIGKFVRPCSRIAAADYNLRERDGYLSGGGEPNERIRIISCVDMYNNADARRGGGGISIIGQSGRPDHIMSPVGQNKD